MMLTFRFRSLYRLSGLRADGEIHVRFESASLILQCVYGVTLFPSGQGNADRPSRYQALANVVSPTFKYNILLCLNTCCVIIYNLGTVLTTVFLNISLPEKFSKLKELWPNFLFVFKNICGHLDKGSA